MDQASTFLASLVVIAASEPTRKVTAPTSATIRPTVVPDDHRRQAQHQIDARP